MPRILAMACAALALCLFAQPAGAVQFDGVARNVELVNDLPEPETGGIAVNFMRYEGGRDVMFVSTSIGLYVFDVTEDPANPVLLTRISGEELRQATGTGDGHFQNEDMDVDPARKLVFMASDVTSGTTTVPGVFIIDAKDPAKPAVITFHPLPEGHTTTCVNGCTHLWTAGLFLRREIFVTDIRNPEMPITSPVPVDLGPFDTPAGSSHDVKVDAEGVAWVSGQGFLRGYWTSGEHLDPFTGQVREATPELPVLYGGGKIAASDGGMTDTGRFLHGSHRPVGKTGTDGAANYGGYGEGNLIYAAEEAYGTCPAGPFVIASLKGALDTTALGTLETVGLWTPAESEGMSEQECSAHWFDMRNGLVAHGWYGQGTRIIDVRDPRNPIQVGYFRPDDATTAAAYWYRGYIYAPDYARGLDVLRYTGPGSTAPEGPSAPAGGAPTPCRPAAVLAGRGHRLTRRSVRLRGRAACVAPGARAQVALASVKAGKCRFLTARGRLGRTADCSKPRWLGARGAKRWTFSRRARLPRGSYSVYVRVAGGEARNYRLTVDRRGRGRATENISAPPKS